MNISESFCKTCLLGYFDIKKYGILNYEWCTCQDNKSNLLSLTNIKSVNCSVAQKNYCDKTMEDMQLSNNIRTTASGINEESISKDYGQSEKKHDTALNTWTCKRCTLLNNENTLICEACESPYNPDFNYNISSNVVIKVDNWADNEALRNSSERPTYRRSFSELSSSSNFIPNISRRSLNSDILHLNVPKSSNSMTDIQSTQSQHSHVFSGLTRDLSMSRGKNLNRSTSDIHEETINGTLYTYIGMIDPEKEKTHFYENQSIINAYRRTGNFDMNRHEKMSSAWGDTDSIQVPIATLDQDLEDDFQMLPGIASTDDQKWTCKKCTLINQGCALTCEACCGSKLKSLSINQDKTLRKGEFWTCSKCTLKNPLTSLLCKVCKTEKNVLDVPVPPKSSSPKNLRLANKNSRSSAEKSLAVPAVKNKINLRSDIELGKCILFYTN